MERPFLEEEIRQAVMGCDENKSPGPDGFSFAIYKECWNTLCDELLEVFADFHEKGIINGVTNETYFCLISKKDNSA